MLSSHRPDDSTHEPRPIIPQRRSEPIADPAWACELKLDGFRGLADTISGRLLSKNLNPLKRYRHLLDDLPFDCVFDGEVCALDQDGRTDFNALLFRGKYPVYVAFDLLFYEREDIRHLPLKERRSMLDKVAKRYSIQKSDLFTGCSKKLYKTVCVLDLEGVVLKKLDHPYDAERTRWWKVPNPNYSQKVGRGELFYVMLNAIALKCISPGFSGRPSRLQAF